MTGDTVDRIAGAVRAASFVHVAERGLHEQVADLLAAAGLPVEREVRLADAERIDLLVGAVGVEVKVKGPANAVLRQLLRYARSDRVEALVLVTTRAAHLRLPRTAGGKPLTVLFVARPW